MDDMSITNADESVLAVAEYRVESLLMSEAWEKVPGLHSVVVEQGGHTRQCQYMGVVVRVEAGGGFCSDHIARFVGMVESLVAKGWITGKLCDPFSLPLAVIDGGTSRAALLAYVFLNQSSEAVTAYLGADYFIDEGSLPTTVWGIDDG